MDLDRAVRDLRTAEAALPRAEQRAAQIIADARDRIDTARKALAAAIIAADRAGVRQRDIVAATGYSREWVRHIIRTGQPEM